MTLWRRTRNEVAGAWRSVRYDLGRREPDADEVVPGPGDDRRAGYPDVTSTGLSTFGGPGLTDGMPTSYGTEFVPRPRRMVAVTAFGALAVAGAAGSYFAVVNGIGSLIGEKPAGAEPYPLAADAPRSSEGELSNSGLGRGAATTPGRQAGTAEPAPGTIRVLPTTAAAAAVPGAAAPRPRRTTVEGTAPATGPTSCDCLTPPVPTPTAPVPTPHSPSAPPSPTASASDSESPTPTESPAAADPSGSEGSDGAADARRH